jgi:outer membrane lipoprotein SlyB
MRGKSVRTILLPVFLAGVLGACANNGVQPGIVNTSNSSYGGSTASAQTYGNAQPGESGRVVSINDVSLRGGGGGSGGGNGPMIGGLLGGLGGMAIGASSGRGIGGGLIGGVLGAVGGAIAGTIIDRNGIGGGGRGIEVTVQKDNGQTVTVAQRDDGDVQLGDRVQVVQDRSGTAKVVRDNGRQPDYGQPPQSYQPAPQDYRNASNYPPPQDYRQAPPQGSGGYGNYGPPPQSSGGYGNYGPPPQQQDYRQAGYSRPQSTTYTPIGGGQYQEYPRGNPQPGDDPRYGTIR